MEDFAPHEDPLIAIRQPPPLHPQRVSPFQPAKSPAMGFDLLSETTADAEWICQSGRDLLEAPRLQPTIGMEKEEQIPRTASRPGILLGGPAPGRHQHLVGALCSGDRSVVTAAVHDDDFRRLKQS